MRKFAVLLLIVATQVFSPAHSQSFGFLGMQWGDSYNVVNKKLAAGGFGELLEMRIHQLEPSKPVTFRLFDGQLLGKAAEGTAWFENGRLIGVRVEMKSTSSEIAQLYEQAVGNLTSRYGRSNLGVSRSVSEWGTTAGESVTAQLMQKESKVAIHYKSARWKNLEQESRERERTKF